MYSNRNNRIITQSAMTSLNMATLLALLPLLSLVVASPSPTPQDGTTPGYTANKRGYSKAPTPLSFESVGDTGVSAQQVSLSSKLDAREDVHDSCQMFLGNNKKVYVIDKAENNPITINGAYGTHPAWATEYDIETNECE